VATNDGYNFLLSTDGPAEPTDTTVGTLTFHGIPVEKHWSNLSGNFQKVNKFLLYYWLQA